MSPRAIRLLAVDDDSLVRQLYRSFFATRTDIELVGECSDGATALIAYESLRPDVVIMDLQMPGMTGIEAIEEICTRWVGARIVALTTFGTKEHIVAALRAGASGYLLKEAGMQALLSGIHQAVRGDMPLSTSVRKALVGSLAGRRAATPPSSEVTDHERDLLRCLTRGMTNQQIARELFLSERAVKQHLARIGERLGVVSRTQILVSAIQRGWVDPLAVSLVANDRLRRPARKRPAAG